jgi:hypothetical protein
MFDLIIPFFSPCDEPSILYSNDNMKIFETNYTCETDSIFKSLIASFDLFTDGYKDADRLIGSEPNKSK